MLLASADVGGGTLPDDAAVWLRGLSGRVPGAVGVRYPGLRYFSGDNGPAVRRLPTRETLL